MTVQKKKAYPLRVQLEILDALSIWAQDEMRSVNSQIEYVLRAALLREGRIKAKMSTPVEVDDEVDENGTDNTSC